MKFSIVTPSYNQLSWLKLCVASVSDQAGVEVEHIIQDAGTDGDLEAWAKPRPGVRLFVESDNGMYDAINRGLLRATGEVCAYLNCDEQYLPNALAKVAEFFAKQPNVNVLFGDVILVDEQGQPLSYRRTILPSLRHIRLAHLNTLSCAMFFRRTLLDRGFYFDPAWKAVGDGVWMEALLRDKVRMATVREPLAVFTFTGKNLGDTTPSRAEAKRRKGDALASRLRQMTAVLGHRLRKAMAGAYQCRNLEIKVYTFKSPERRVHIVGKQVGFSWPST